MGRIRNGDCSFYNAATNLVFGRDILLRRSSQSFVVVVVVVVVVVNVVVFAAATAAAAAVFDVMRVGITCSRLRLSARAKDSFFDLPSQEGLVQKRQSRFYKNILSLRCVLCIYVHVFVASVRQSECLISGCLLLYILIYIYASQCR